MDMNAIQNAIGSFGFPIVACAMMYMEMKETRKSHQEEMKLMTDALNNNTRVLERLEVKMNVQ